MGYVLLEYRFTHSNTAVRTKIMAAASCILLEALELCLVLYISRPADPPDGDQKVLKGLPHRHTASILPMPSFNVYFLSHKKRVPVA